MRRWWQSLARLAAYHPRQPKRASTARYLLTLIIIDMAALLLIGAVILLAAAAWQFLTGGVR